MVENEKLNDTDADNNSERSREGENSDETTGSDKQEESNEEKSPEDAIQNENLNDADEYTTDGNIERSSRNPEETSETDKLEGDNSVENQENQKADKRELSPEEKEKLDSWKYRPDNQLYLDNKEVFDNPKYYNQETGEINWPPNDGVDGEVKNVTLEPGTKIDRYGDDNGYYASPVDTPYENRAVAPGTDLKPYNQFEVMKPIEAVEEGSVAPWFD